MPPISKNDSPLGSRSPHAELAEHLCKLYARVRRPVLFLGPVGAGKTTLARRLHALSRRPGRLVTVSCGELTDGLYADTLFGHVEGAYTGASRPGTGAFQQSEDGTLLLDDLALMPIRAQAAILRAMEERCYRPLGAAKDRRTSSRLVFASTVALDELVSDGRLLPDLWSRVGELVVPVPGLGERRSELRTMAIRMADDFLDENGYDVGVELTPEAEALLASYPWPGNLRELRGVVERAVIHSGMNDGGVVIDACHLPDRLHESPVQAQDSPALSRTLVATVLDRVGGNQSEAARRLGVHRNTIARYTRTAG